MNVVLETLKTREELLDSVIAKIKRSRKKVPDRRIRICKNKNGRIQYYLLTDSENKTGKYIKKKDRGVAYAIAQKEYNRRVLELATKEKNYITKFRKNVKPIQFEDVYANMCKDRKDMISPVYLPDDEFVKRWLSVEYEKLPFTNKSPEYYSQKGERMRSKSEVIIADMLTKYNIPYMYEYPIELADIGIVHPDFRILNVRKRKIIFWEHYGLMDDRDYRNDKMIEIEKYHKSGYVLGDNFIFSMETMKCPLSINMVDQFIRCYCL